MKGLLPDKTSGSPASLSGNNGGRRRRTRESLHCVLKERSFYFFFIKQKRKKRSPHLTDPEFDALRVSNLKKKRKSWTLGVSKPNTASSI